MAPSVSKSMLGTEFDLPSASRTADERICRYVNEIVRIFAGRYQRLVSVHDGFVEIRMPHISPVDEEIVLVPASAHGIRPSDESFDFHE